MNGERTEGRSVIQITQTISALNSVFVCFIRKNWSRSSFIGKKVRRPRVLVIVIVLPVMRYKNWQQSISIDFNRLEEQHI